MKTANDLLFEPMVPWLQWGFREMSQEIAEVIGDKHDPRILFYHKHTKLEATRDEISWCSAFVCAGFENVGIRSTRSPLARSWNKWGLELDGFREGAVAAFWRVEADGWQGHVGWAVKETKSSILLLGGNQGNRVCLQHYPKDQLLGFRWPDSYLPS